MVARPLVFAGTDRAAHHGQRNMGGVGGIEVAKNREVRQH